MHGSISAVWLVALSLTWALAAQGALLNGQFDAELEGGWEALGAQGERSVAPREGLHGTGALILARTTGRFGVRQSTQAQIPILKSGAQPQTGKETDAAVAGAAVKLRVWIKVTEASGDSYASLELVRPGGQVEQLARTIKASGSTAAYFPRWVVADIPADAVAAHLRICLISEDNTGTVAFDDVMLKPLPPNVPSFDAAQAIPTPQRGQITVKDGHLVDANAQRIRLWGVNCVDEPGRDYRQIDSIIDRIKRMGFNAIRLHLYDVRLIDTEAQTAAGEPTSRVFRTSAGRGDGSMLDKFDYFIYRAEQAGLYLYLTFDRLRARFGPGDYDIMASAGAEDEQSWKKAVSEANPKRANEHLYFVDERLGAVQAEYVSKQLDHRNAYTGLRIADDPYIALYELTNENGFPLTLIEGKFRRWPEYFQKVLQQRWNAWLRERYGGPEKLLAAWGSLREGEDLAQGSVALAPTGGETKDYPRGRLADVRRFVYDLTIGYSRRLEAVIRGAGTCSAKAPVTYDTIYTHKHTWYYPMSQGTCQAVGTYVTGSLELGRENSWLGKPPTGIYNLSNSTVADKPIIVYETNIHKPAAQRAYYPMLISTYASTHDWDAVFWYVWSNGTVYDQVDDEVYDLTGLRYAAPAHIWHAIVISTDEVLLSSLRVAGEAFTRFLVPAAPEPVIVNVGADDLLGRSTWIGDIGVPYPKDAPGPYVEAAAIGATDMLYTCRYRYSMDEESSSVSRPLIARTPPVCSPVEGLTYDFERGAIIVDRPGVKAVVGFADKAWTFGDGVGVEAPGVPFFTFGLVATDGKPLVSAQKAMLTFSTYGENRGRIVRENPDEVKANVSRHAKLIASWGYGPPELLRPAVRVNLPGRFEVRGRDFRWRPLQIDEGVTIRWPTGCSMFVADLQRVADRGDPQDVN